MGNRAIITTRSNYENNGVGVYLHWNGGRDSVEAFLAYCKMKSYRAPEQDCYGWARLCQVVGNFFGGGLSVGIDILSNLPSGEWCDNGVYIIENWEIVDRKFYEGAEQNHYNRDEMIAAIDEAQPAEEQFGRDYLKAPEIKPSEMKIGDKIAFVDWHDKRVTAEVIGFGGDGLVNGSDVKGVPYTSQYGMSGKPENNINNYLFDNRVYRKIQ